ncbi:hypothetical protein C8J56DRAFT_902350 [Mycena floridula]|nr:hypothetical protein C8J56DRAFT_902350 [Mycena floridula]
MSSTQISSEPRKILVIGGTGAQGQRVVADLVRDGKYICTVLTRDIDNPIAKSLEALGNVVLLKGSYDKEDDLRTALKGHYGVYSNHNSFSMTEAAEYFWTFRLYDIAVQSGVQHFVYSSIFNRPKQYNYAEEYRAPHMLTKGRIAEWLSVQPVSLLPWTILTGVLYTEMLQGSWRPDIDASGTYVFSSATGDGAIQFVELAQYGRYTRWSFDNPSRSVGKEIALAAYTSTSKEIAQVFQRVTGKKAIGREITPEDLFSRRPGFDASVKMPLQLPGGQDDDSRFSYQRYFTAFWNVWSTFKCLLHASETDALAEDMTPEVANALPGLELADEIYPDRCRSVEDWMSRTGYTGEPGQVLKEQV